MRFRIETAVRQVVIIDGLATPTETRALVDLGFRFKDGMWSRQFRLRPMVAGTVEEIPGCGVLLRAAGPLGVMAGRSNAMPTSQGDYCLPKRQDMR